MACVFLPEQTTRAQKNEQKTRIKYHIYNSEIIHSIFFLHFKYHFNSVFVLQSMEKYPHCRNNLFFNIHNIITYYTVCFCSEKHYRQCFPKILYVISRRTKKHIVCRNVLFRTRIQSHKEASVFGSTFGYIRIPSVNSLPIWNALQSSMYNSLLPFTYFTQTSQLKIAQPSLSISLCHLSLFVSLFDSNQNCSLRDLQLLPPCALENPLTVTTPASGVRARVRSLARVTRARNTRIALKTASAPRSPLDA